MDGETIRMRDIEAEPGTRAQGFLTIGETRRASRSGRRS
jgi:hypothetical protein